MSKKPDLCFCCDPDWELCLDECSFTPFLFLQKQIIRIHRAAVTPHSNMMTITVADTTAATISPLLELLLVSGGGEVLDTAGEGSNVETAALEDGLKLLLAGILESTAVARDCVVVGVVIGEETESVEAVRRALDVFQTESVENSSLVSKVVVVAMVLSLGRPTPADDIENGSGNEDTDGAIDCTVRVKIFLI